MSYVLNPLPTPEPWRYCRDCAAMTFRCWQHSSWFESIPAITIVPETVVIPAITIVPKIILPVYWPPIPLNR